MIKFRGIVAGVAAAVGLVFGSIVGGAPASAQIFGGSGGPFTGFYVGAHAGYGWARNSDPSINGAVGGVHVGVNQQLGSILLGVEADYSFSGMEGSNTIAGVNLTAGVDSLWSVRGRLGWVPVNNLLVFATAGYGGFDVEVTGTLVGLRATADASYNGLVWGGGAEVLLTRNLSARLEGLQYKGDGNGLASGSTGDVNVLRAGLSYKF